MTFAIETVELTKRFRKFTAVDSLSLAVPSGTVFGLLGPNGAGKTTTIMMALGNVRPTSGTATLLGKPCGDIGARRRVGFLPEKFQFHDFLTAKEFLQLHGKLSGLSSAELGRRVPAILERVGLAERTNSRIREFSKGMQQRIGLAQAILHSPDLVILDEPTSALDPLARRDVLVIITELKVRGATVILNSHLLSEVETACDHIAILNRGTVVAQGALSDILKHQAVVAVEVRELNDAALAAIRGIAVKLRLERVPITRFTAYVRSENDISELARAIVENGCRLLELTPRKDTLEDLYIRTLAEASA